MEKIFLSVKLDATGNFKWAKRIGSTGDDQGIKISSTPDGGVVSTGFYYGKIDIDPGTDSTFVTSSGNADIYLCKLDSNGKFIFGKSIGGPGYDVSNDIVIDQNGTMYTIGMFNGTVDFNPGSGTNNLSVTGNNANAFVSILDSLGNYIWAGRYGGAFGVVGNGITLDDSGNILTTGHFSGQVDFDPGTSNYTLTGVNSPGGSPTMDVFVVKLNPSGNFIWAAQLGGNDWDYGYAISSDSAGSVFSTGTFYGKCDFDPGSSKYELSAGGNDIYISKLDRNGQFVWAKKIGGSSIDYGLDILTDELGSVLTTGYFMSVVDFDPGSSTYQLKTFSSSGEIYIQKMENCVTVYSNDSATACDSFQYHNKPIKIAVFITLPCLRSEIAIV